MRILSFIIITCLIFTACTSDPVDSFKELNLLSYGVPITIMAPDSPDVKKEDWITQQGITVTKGEDFDLQIWAGQASSLDVATLKAEKLAEVKTNKLFSQVIKEEPNGFIFENKIDSAILFYGFYHLRIQGDNQYIFQNGLRGNFTKEQAETMYKAVQPIKK